MWIATREPLKTWGAADDGKSIHHLDAELAWEAWWGDGSPTKEWRGPHNSLSEAWNSELKVKLVGSDLRCRAERIPLDDSSEQPATLEFPLPGSGLEPLLYYVADQDGVPILLNGVQRGMRRSGTSRTSVATTARFASMPMIAFIRLRRSLSTASTVMPFGQTLGSTKRHSV